MKLITSNDVDYDNIEVLGKVFLDSGLDANVKESEGFGNARVDISFPLAKDDNELVVMVWVSSGQPEILKFRVILLNRKERDGLKKDDNLWEAIIEYVNMQNQNAFACLSPLNMAGITLEYGLTIKGGIADSTLVNTAKEIFRIAQGAKSGISLTISFED